MNIDLNYFIDDGKIRCAHVDQCFIQHISDVKQLAISEDLAKKLCIYIVNRFDKGYTNLIIQNYNKFCLSSELVTSDIWYQHGKIKLLSKMKHHRYRNFLSILLDANQHGDIISFTTNRDYTSVFLKSNESLESLLIESELHA